MSLIPSVEQIISFIKTREYMANVILMWLCHLYYYHYCYHRSIIIIIIVIIIRVIIIIIIIIIVIIIQIVIIVIITVIIIVVVFNCILHVTLNFHNTCTLNQNGCEKKTIKKCLISCLLLKCQIFC